MSSVAEGKPTKEFFVSMLTRDIDLGDAILDLLDNCLDGAVRLKGQRADRNAEDFYAGFYSNITFTKSNFTIEDNCGGISRRVAETSAFRWGRTADFVEDDEVPTVGIYGIGMKRAIFKMGKSASVVTRNKGSLYKVDIPLSWVGNSKDWDFIIEDIDDPKTLPDGGTIVTVENINQEISEKWNTVEKINNFTVHLIRTIQQSYSFIIEKGFKITVNGISVYPLPIQLLVADELENAAIKPFLYNQVFDDVNVSLAVGFYAPPPSPDEIDDENNLRRSSSDAGWTIVCNDRVILYNDKSHLTGWGEAGVPQYHTQFVGIRGIVFFTSGSPEKLPMTTTKRGIDTSSKIYSAVKDRMRQGLKMFTDYTNRWKGQNEQERYYSSQTKKVPVELLVGSPVKVQSDNPVRFHQSRGALVSSPNLPNPSNDKPYQTIRFSRSSEDILNAVEFFYDDRTHEVTPSQVGEKCFSYVLNIARERKGR